MPTGIPLPGDLGELLRQGIATGGDLYTRMMQLNNANKNSDLERALLEQKVLEEKNKNDPMYEINNLRNVMAMFQGQNPENGQGNQQGISPPNPTQLVGQGMGALSPQGLQAEQSKPPKNIGLRPYDKMQNSEAQLFQKNGNIGGINLNAVMQHPVLRSYFKHHFGYDPIDDYTGAAREASDLEKLRIQTGENSPVYQNAKAQYDASLNAKKDLSELRERTKTGLKPGETEFFDEKTRVPLGKNVPLTAEQRKEDEGNILFNTLYPLAYAGASPFWGEGSITRLQNAAANYKKDPKARQEFDDYLLSEKLLFANTVNEAATLGTRGTNQTYNMLKESLDAQDIPNIVKKLIKQYEIPASAGLRASQRYQKVLSDARNKAKSGVGAYRKYYYNPEQQDQTEQQLQEKSINPIKFNDNDIVKVRTPNGVQKMTYSEAKKLGAKYNG